MHPVSMDGVNIINDELGPVLDSAPNRGGGILRLAPTWVPRSFCVPGRRIKLHPDDDSALGGERGGIDECCHCAGYRESWICHKSDAFNAKELTVLPGATVTLHDAAAYGMIMMQGHGRMGAWEMETPALIRYGQLTHDEFFVRETAAREGVKISNPSPTDPIVMLKHFGPANPELEPG